MAKLNDPGQVYEGFLEEAPTTHTKRRSPAANSVSNMMEGGSLPFVLSAAPDFLKDAGIVRLEDDSQIMAAQDDTAELMKKLKKVNTIRAGGTYRHKKKGTILVVLKTNVDRHESGKPRHLVVEKDSGTKLKIVESLLKPL